MITSLPPGFRTLTLCTSNSFRLLISLFTSILNDWNTFARYLFLPLGGTQSEIASSNWVILVILQPVLYFTIAFASLKLLTSSPYDLKTFRRSFREYSLISSSAVNDEEEFILITRFPSYLNEKPRSALSM